MFSSKLHLVIGGAGFIGVNLCDLLTKSGAKVLCVDDYSNSVSQKKIVGLNYKIIKGDINNINIQRKIVKLVNLSDSKEILVWHLAANSDIQKSAYFPELDIDKTLKTSLSVIKLCSEFDSPRVVFASSSAIYGESSNHLNENDSFMTPVSSYGIAKLASELFFRKSLDYELQGLFIFRFPNVIGSPSTHGVLHDWKVKIKKNPKTLEVLGDGSQKKQFLHVKTLLKMMFFVIENSQNNLNVYNLSNNDDGLTIKDLSQLFQVKSLSDFDIKFGENSIGWRGDINSYKLDVTKLGQLGWKFDSNSKLEATMAIDELFNRHTW
jgi:UDP-glucose 4-epimerase